MSCNGFCYQLARALTPGNFLPRPISQRASRRSCRNPGPRPTRLLLTLVQSVVLIAATVINIFHFILRTARVGRGGRESVRCGEGCWDEIVSIGLALLILTRYRPIIEHCMETTTDSWTATNWHTSFIVVLLISLAISTFLLHLTSM